MRSSITPFGQESTYTTQLSMPDSGTTGASYNSVSGSAGHGISHNSSENFRGSISEYLTKLAKGDSSSFSQQKHQGFGTAQGPQQALVGQQTNRYDESGFSHATSHYSQPPPLPLMDPNHPHSTGAPSSTEWPGTSWPARKPDGWSSASANAEQATHAIWQHQAAVLDPGKLLFLKGSTITIEVI